MLIARPFVKWAGGKGHVLKTLETFLPRDLFQQQAVTYVEPFVGGGAMLFHMLQNHSNIHKAIVNDINADLIETYRIIKDNPDRLISELTELQDFYLAIKTEEQRKHVYLDLRNEYNNLARDLCFERAKYFMFLNHTCFNGLYRENRKGQFNVPCGRYKNPTICNADNIKLAHELLQRVDLVCGSYEGVMNHMEDENTFVYFDPPYRPLCNTSNFNDYNSTGFGDSDQERLKEFCDELTEMNCKIMLSNSDSLNNDGSSYFEELYQVDLQPRYHIERIHAPRYINAFAAKRVPINEVLILNFQNNE